MLKRVGTIIGCFLMTGIVISLCSGLLAVILYSILGNQSGIQQITNIIDIVVGCMSVLLMPINLSIFWNIVKRQGSLKEDFLRGLHISIVQYLINLAVVCTTLGLGFGVLCITLLIPEGLLRILISIFLMFCIGAGFLILTWKINQYFTVEKEDLEGGIEHEA